MMTVEEYLRRSADPRWYGDQDANGVELSIICDNLVRTSMERLRRGDTATTDALRVRKHVERIYPVTA